jgi:hypothetical protein
MDTYENRYMSRRPPYITSVTALQMLPYLTRVMAIETPPYLSGKVKKADPLHTKEAHGGRRGIAPTHN